MMATIKDLLKETKESIRRSAKIEERLISVKESVGDLKVDTKDTLSKVVNKIQGLKSNIIRLEAKVQSLEDRINTVFQAAVLNSLEKLEREDFKKLAGLDKHEDVDRTPE